ncbi:XRE family transcriptional regulator [Streptococcus chenjunshii]|uniref:XRE family transcriptional regulator n=1 Tax=Streptococcus chenjunshii TaxID=2173853 RepID=A0A372KNC0_9STRE|nr:XRE family transcriptional regulator [Streptococcus chenjunshii]AXQ77833.1 XRE family transcriptional regulator [Streptococcus chenjunshii]RFU51344.1 XRE family transcriptional regulator [Streptococcus chenjunshii]RFU53782.1 XRE family transcriptional regulator [Streptococcus chenjunshii]
MKTKEIIGANIRTERERQGLSREQVCGLESELTVRQLMRIELGQSLPTIVKLEYLADRLKVDMASLLGEQSLEIPQAYFEQKYKLIKFPSYGDAERLAQKTQLLEDIYNQYFDYLPEEELFTLDLLENFLDYITVGKPESVELIYEDFFKQLLLKETYSLNDILLARHYLTQCQDYAYDRETVLLIVDRLLKQRTGSNDYYNLALLGALFALAGVYVVSADYSDMKPALDKMDDVVNQTMQHVYKPGLLMFEAKYHLYQRHNFQKAKSCYDLALTLAENFGDTVLIDNLKKEKAKDLQEKEE